MNRPQRTEWFAAVADDGLVVVSAFTHPGRGPVECPAAPLVSAWLNARGVPNRIAPLTGGPGRAVAGPGSGGGEGQLAATTYPAPDGRILGLAVLAPTLFADTAGTAVSTWGGCLRTRRLVVPELVPHCDGSLAPGPSAPASALTDGNSCPSLAGAREAAFRHRAEHRTVLLLGAPHDTASAMTCPVPDPTPGLIPIPDPDAAARLAVADPRNLAFVVAPCADVRNVSRVVAVLRERFPLLRGQHPDQWCYRATDNQHVLEAAVRHSDLVLSTLGTPLRAPHVGRLVNVRSLADLRPPDLARATTVTLVGPPLPPAPGTGPTVADLTGVLTGLGPTSVVRQRFRSEVAVPAAAPPAHP
ncbi:MULTISPECIES: hypothetical protein [Kitasatospora]|uniref:4-hydroxy-3-methylbut-2-enyl diphosphate reductase n=1 Tax=Kitasatospora setae (strain ATCC 33774 / DSM 43861 / JCM 3304 / KCC A-0304 / NBRC 14216 / KM-6054) TaxID=452652 RepID=E4NJB2_KITSK|nr:MULTISPECIES: hypothetical protein [Kitasatospora]BAJ33060.1 hypothetical protein KSE_73050 [Kitasatospora setae KM-6054]